MLQKTKNFLILLILSIFKGGGGDYILIKQVFEIRSVLYINATDIL